VIAATWKWVANRGFGFIIDAERVRYFVHHSGINGKTKPFVGAQVLFDICPEKEGANPSAMDVDIIASVVGEVG
jgi:cold shock CspA family protein